MSLWCIGVSCFPASGGEEGGISAVQEADLRTAKLQLSDPSREMKTKVEAAGQLLERNDYPAIKTLGDFLSDASNPKARQAICLAICNNGGGPKELVDPLLKILTGTDAAVRGNAAQALSAYRGGGVLHKVLQVAGDEKQDPVVRVAAIDSVSRVPSKMSVEELIRLLDDYDASVRSAAASGLVRMTGIKGFGADHAQWVAWWEKNRDKGTMEWAGDITEAMSKRVAELQAEAKLLRARLGQVYESSYLALPPGAARDAKLLEMLKDPMAEVRLIGLKMADQASANQKLPSDVLVQIRLLLSDPDVSVRQSAAAAMAGDADGQSLGLLLGRLEVEDAVSVRQEILKAIGQIGSREGIPKVLAAISSPDSDIAAAAAVALTKISQKNPLEGPILASAASALETRYRQAKPGANGGTLRESLLRAMGAVGGDELLKVLREALVDPSATIRQAAVNGLRQLKAADAAVEIAPLVDDQDRGVRQSAIEALGVVGGQKYLPVVLRRADASVESDATVRQKSWDAVQAICAGSDVKTLKDVLSSLDSGKGDVLPGKIKLMQVLADKLKASASPDLADVMRDLGLAMVSAGRLSEASTAFAEAYSLYKASSSPLADAVWTQWVDSLLAGDDSTVVKVIAGAKSQEDFSRAMSKFNLRLQVLSGKRDWLPLFRLADEGVKQFAGRLTDDQKKAMELLRDQAKTEQASADRARTTALALQLASPDEQARKSAETELKGMGQRAVKPLLDELKKTLSDQKANPQQEKAILDVLRQIAPTLLADYDLASPVEQKIKLVSSKLEAN